MTVSAAVGRGVAHVASSGTDDTRLVVAAHSSLLFHCDLSVLCSLSPDDDDLFPAPAPVAAKKAEPKKASLFDDDDDF